MASNVWDRLTLPLYANTTEYIKNAIADTRAKHLKTLKTKTQVICPCSNARSESIGVSHLVYAKVL